MKKLLFAVAALFVATSGFAQASASGSDPAFGKFVDDYFDAKFADSPTEGTSAGLHQYDTKMPDLSRAAIDARVAALKGQLTRLLAFDRAKLGFDDAIDAAALEGSIRSELLTLETLRPWEKNPMQYAGVAGSAVDDLMKRNFAPAPDRLRSVVARLKAVPAICAAGKANVKNPPKEFTTLAIRMAKGSAGFLSGGVADWAKASGADAALMKEFTETNGKAVAALNDFATWLEKDLAPRSNGSYAIGAANFSAKLLYDDMVEMPLSEVLAIGEADLAKNYAAFLETAKKIDASKTPSQVMRSLSDNHPTPANLIPSVAKGVESARRFLVEKNIVTIPSEVRPVVTETPPFARFGSFASMDTPGAYETKATEAFYYVTPVEKDWDAKHMEEHLRLYNPYVVSIIDVHEVWPGHYLQFLYAPRFPTTIRPPRISFRPWTGRSRRRAATSSRRTWSRFLRRSGRGSRRRRPLPGPAASLPWTRPERSRRRRPRRSIT